MTAFPTRYVGTTQCPGRKDLTLTVVSGRYRDVKVNGSNKVDLALKGDTLKVTVNGTELYTGSTVYYDRVKSPLFIWGSMASNATLKVKKVEVKYGGEPIEEELAP